PPAATTTGVAGHRAELRDTALWLSIALCAWATVATTSVHSSALVLVLFVCFWAALVSYLAATVGPRDVVWFIPLVALYFFAFYSRRQEPNTGAMHGVLATDTMRLLRLANRWCVEERHTGWPLFTFVLHPAQQIGLHLGLSHLGEEAVYLEMAVIGM